MNIEKVKKVMEDIKDQELEIISRMARDRQKLEKAKDVLRVLVAYKDNLKKNENNN